MESGAFQAAVWAVPETDLSGLTARYHAVSQCSSDVTPLGAALEC